MTDEEFETRAYRIKLDLKYLTQRLAFDEEEIESIYGKLEKCMNEYSDIVDDMEFDDHIEKLSEQENLLER